MKQWILGAFAAAFLLTSCGNNTQSTSANMSDAMEDAATAMDNAEPAPDPDPMTMPSDHPELIGYYVGMFEAAEYDENKKPMWSNKINISVDHIAGNKIVGHSVVAGNARPFEGEIENEDGLWMVDVKEPGDDKYDGKFSFAIHSDGSMKGQWYANNKSLAVTKREYDLEKKTFKYDANNGIPTFEEFTSVYDSYNEETGQEEVLTDDCTRLNASVKALKKEDIENLYKGDLEVIRNAIYARHGYSFKNRKMRFFFDNNVDWYIPMSTDVRGDLTDLEVKNIDLIKRYEQHADRYYDSFGR